ncbi:MAG TPA: hypothetical protein VFW41_05410 [Gaiellaceae bacterium]|nr:hypothetical protein [Gaiellaceae bacterium]
MSEEAFHPTRVPGAEEAVAPDHKFTDYLLNLEHPIGGAKARFFLSIGWSPDRWQELRDHFLAQLPLVEGRFSRVNDFNGAADYEAVIELPRENGEMVRVGTYWQVHPDQSTKFLTAYPL